MSSSEIMRVLRMMADVTSSSTEPSMVRCRTRTGLVWPTRCTRSLACLFVPGVQSVSTNTTSDAAVSVMPVDRSSTGPRSAAG